MAKRTIVRRSKAAKKRKGVSTKRITVKKRKKRK